MMIAGFKITKQHIMIVGGIILVVGLIGLSSHLKEQQKKAEAAEEAKKAAEEYQKNQ